MTAPPAPATLDQLAKGSRAVVVDVDGDDGIAIRIMEMGVLEGEAIECLGAAPLGDPLEFLVRGYRLSLRVAEAKRVRIRGV